MFRCALIAIDKTSFDIGVLAAPLQQLGDIALFRHDAVGGV